MDIQHLLYGGSHRWQFGRDISQLLLCYCNDSLGVRLRHFIPRQHHVLRPLAEALRSHCLEVWYDEFELKIWMNLRRTIDKGIAGSRFGIVVISKAFFGKGWTNYELDGIVTRSVSSEQTVLAIWHNVSKQEVIGYSLPLADKVARRTATHTVAEVAAEIADLIQSSKEGDTAGLATPDLGPLPAHAEGQEHDQGAGDPSEDRNQDRHRQPDDKHDQGEDDAGKVPAADLGLTHRPRAGRAGRSGTVENTIHAHLSLSTATIGGRIEGCGGGTVQQK